MSPGATLGKGLNRGMGTILGGGLGCLVAVSAQLVGGVGNSVIIGASVSIFGTSSLFNLHDGINNIDYCHRPNIYSSLRYG